MSKKWFIPLLLALPFLPVLLWGQYLPEAAYASLRTLPEMGTETSFLAQLAAGYQPLSRPLFPMIIAFAVQMGEQASRTAVVLGTLGWGTAALLIWWLGLRLKYNFGALATALLFCFNPWVVLTMGQSTGWIIAIFWLLANFVLRRRYLVSLLGVLFLVSLFFRPSQGFSWPVDLAAPLLWSLLLFTTGIGVEWLARYLAKNDHLGITQKQATALFLGLFFLLAGVWQANQFWQLFTARPLAEYRVDAEVSAWLHANTDTEATLLATDKIGVLSGRDNKTGGPAELQELLTTGTPDYVVVESSLPWQLLREAIWFRLYYEPVAIFADPQAAQSAKEVWALRQISENSGPVTLLNARVPDELSLLGYQVNPQPAQPGEPLTVTLHMQTPEANLSQPNSFLAILRLVSPLDGSTAGEWTLPLPQGINAHEWEAGKVLSEQIQLPLPARLDSAAYALNLSLQRDKDSELWPFAFNNDVNRLDRIPLGFVTIPWTGDYEDAVPVEAEFEEGIRLAGYEANQFARDGDMALTLYWETSAAVEEMYTVFVHLLDENGVLVASHDGLPANGRFPTAAWLPEMVVADEHALFLSPDLAPGQYEIRAGLYNPQNGERLAVPLIGGEPYAGDFVPLGVVEIE